MECILKATNSLFLNQEYLDQKRRSSIANVLVVRLFLH